MADPHAETILILDFGSQYTQLITRKVRELGVYSEIHPYTLSLDEIKKISPKGIILSGGPASVYEDGAPLPDKAIFELGCPVLGICYGLQLMAYYFDGRVDSAAHREYGSAQLSVKKSNGLFQGFGSETKVWMSHGDRVEQLPEHFEVLAGAQILRFAVSSRSDAYRAGQGVAEKFCDFDLRLFRDLDHGEFYRDDRGENSRDRRRQ